MDVASKEGCLIPRYFRVSIFLLLRKCLISTDNCDTGEILLSLRLIPGLKSAKEQDTLEEKISNSLRNEHFREGKTQAMNVNLEPPFCLSSQFLILSLHPTEPRLYPGICSPTNQDPVTHSFQ